MSKAARRKGHQFERDIANRLKEVFPNARRHLEYQSACANGMDIANTEPYFFQCKKLKKYASITCIEEVKCDEALGDIPVLVTAGDGKPIMAVLPFEELIRLFKADREARFRRWGQKPP